MTSISIKGISLEMFQKVVLLILTQENVLVGMKYNSNYGEGSINSLTGLEEGLEASLIDAWRFDKHINQFKLRKGRNGLILRWK